MKDSVKQKSAGFYLTALLVILVLTVLDRVTKHLAVIHLKDQAPVPIIRGVLELQYLENRGAAWGMLSGRQWFFWIVTVIFLVICLLYLLKVPAGRRYRPLTITVLFLAAGAIGNFIDRITQRYVVDFIYFRLIDFPIFNVADIYVSVAVTVLILLILFYYKEEDFSFLK